MYIYKIMSHNDWQESQALGSIKRLALDTTFIHMCSEDQISMIIEKFWQHEPNILIAKLDPTKVIGRLVYEANPGGNNKYYHLYDGHIPLTAVVDTALLTNTTYTLPDGHKRTFANP